MNRVLAAGGVVVNQQKELLMIYRRLLWDLPKGHLEKNETLQECALREVREETGIQNLELISFLGITEHQYYDQWIKSEAIKEVHWFEMKADKNCLTIPLEAEGIESIQWIKAGMVQRYLSRSFDNLGEIVRKSSLFS